MKPEYRLLLACVRQDFSDPYRETVQILCRHHPIDWLEVYETATLHGVEPLVYANLERCDPDRLGIPPAIQSQFKLRRYQVLIGKEERAQRLLKALAAFNRQGVDVMIIKGGALDLQVYNEPWYVVPQDIDLVFRPRRTEISPATWATIGNILEGHGLEYDFFAHHDVTMNGILPVDFRHIWQQATPVDYQGERLLVMSPEDMLLTACINSCRKRFFRLKSLCDIAEITHTHYDRLDWDRLATSADEFGCRNILYTALLTTEMTLGCRLPNRFLAGLKVGSLRRAAIRYLSQRASPVAFSALYSGPTLLGRHVDPSLLLSYTVFTWSQTWRRLGFVLFYTEDGRPRSTKTLGRQPFTVA